MIEKLFARPLIFRHEPSHSDYLPDLCVMFGNILLDLIFEKNVVELGLKDSGENP